MSYSAAIDAVKSALSADPISSLHPSVTLHYAPDPRLDTLADLDGYVDGAFLLANESAGNPYPYVQGNNATEFFASIKLQVCTFLMTDVIAEDKTASARAQAIFDVLVYSHNPLYSIFDVTDATRSRTAEDRRVIWEIKFKLRYTE